MSVMSRKRWLWASLSALAIVILISSWVLFAPSQLGGSAAYVTISGNSMEPQFRKGDLVIVRQVDSYEVGDIVVYRSPIMGTVIHRIVDRTSNGFVLRGDSNDWDDSYRPSPQEIIGRYWLHFPRGGNVVKALRTPVVWTVLIIVAGIAIIPSAFKPSAHGSPREDEEAPKPRSRSRHLRGNRSRDYVFLFSALGFASLALGFASWPKPPILTVQDTISYEHTGELLYSSSVPSDVYDTRRLQPGEPIFRQLTDEVNITFEYRLISQHPAEVTGAFQLSARVSDVNGWKRTFTLIPDTTFSDISLSASGTLVLSDIQHVIEEMETETGLHKGQYQLTITPSVSLEGTLAGIAFTDSFTPTFDFRFDSLQVQYIGAAPPGTTPLKPTEAKALVGEHVEPNHIPLFFIKMRVSLAKAISASTLAIAIIGVCVTTLRQARAGRQSQAARIALQYGHLLVSVSHTNLPDQGIVEVGSFEDMAAIAEQEGRLILHEAHDDVHLYAMQTGELTYHYRLGPELVTEHETFGVSMDIPPTISPSVTSAAPPSSDQRDHRTATTLPARHVSSHPVSEEAAPTAVPQTPSLAIQETINPEAASDAVHHADEDPQVPVVTEAPASPSPTKKVPLNSGRQEAHSEPWSWQPEEGSSSPEVDNLPDWLRRVRVMAAKDALQGRSWHALALDEKVDQCGLSSLTKSGWFPLLPAQPEERPFWREGQGDSGAVDPTSQDRTFGKNGSGSKGLTRKTEGHVQGRRP